MDRFTAMETFVGVLETGSFSAGARRMHVGQPAVSKSIAQAVQGALRRIENGTHGQCLLDGA